MLTVSKYKYDSLWWLINVGVKGTYWWKHVNSRQGFTSFCEYIMYFFPATYNLELGADLEKIDK